MKVYEGTPPCILNLGTNGKIQTSTVLLSDKEVPVPTKQQTGWVLDGLDLAGIPALSLVLIPAAVSRLCVKCIDIK
jgi:hypothetical protein